ncbi:MAG: ADP-heptose--LPS heptosyltransferase [Magnetovibrio sp.]|nr:ADP-heptose--LPS heptosyltransferase [Magnetovibrio sp.]|tara:strand:+ start:812 stop:1735 length:924 start_codon:yes stop_codon:yes gene_type:complete
MAGNILVIKLAALGDFIQAIRPFTAIRNHHPNSHITLLTSKPFVELAEASSLFDQIWVDNKPKVLAISEWVSLRAQLRSGGFERVYDLQTSDRSSFYRLFFWPRQNPEWSGIASGCSHPHKNPRRDLMHTIERQAEQLEIAGVKVAGITESLDFLNAPVDQFALPNDFVLLVPGGAIHRPKKRWSTEKYSELARQFFVEGLVPILLGGISEAEILEEISINCPQAINLCGQTSLLQIATLARQARLSVGNDTGPMHLIAAVGRRTVVLYGNSSDPALCGQRGPHVTYLRKPNIKDITVESVKAVSIA